MLTQGLAPLGLTAVAIRIRTGLLLVHGVQWFFAGHIYGALRDPPPPLPSTLWGTWVLATCSPVSNARGGVYIADIIVPLGQSVWLPSSCRPACVVLPVSRVLDLG